MKKRCLATMLSLCMIVCLLPQVAFAADETDSVFYATDIAYLAGGSNPFSDVLEDDWFFEDVVMANAQGLMKGTDNTVFSPYANTTRGMIVTILWRMEDEPEAAAANPFTDVSTGKYYRNAVTWAAKNHIVDGYGNGRFGPEDSITREQLSVILYRYAQFKNYEMSFLDDSSIQSFEDVSEISDWAVAAVEWAQNVGIIQGSAGYVWPKNGAQRCQTAAILIRFLNAAGSAKVSPVSETLEAVLRGDGTFYDTGTKGIAGINHLNRIVSSDDTVTAKAIKYAVIDLDNDGINEVVLQLNVNGNADYGSLILRCQGEAVYGYSVPYRAFYQLKSDGTFSISSGAADSGFGSMTFPFPDRQYNAGLITFSESAYNSDNNLTVYFFVNNRPATREAYETAIKAQADKPDAVWYDFPIDSIANAISNA